MYTLSAILIFSVFYAKSLEDKRQGCRSLLDKTRQRFNVSIAEADTQDVHQTLHKRIKDLNRYLSEENKESDDEMKNEKKKELQMKYLEKEVVGGVYMIRNTINNKLFIEAAEDLHGSKNRFVFAQKTNSCIYMKMQKDWTEYGGNRFVYEVLEKVRKRENQTQAEFKADIGLLKDLWREKYADADLY